MHLKRIPLIEWPELKEIVELHNKTTYTFNITSFEHFLI